jgi:transposase
MLREHRDEYQSQWAASESIAPNIGCTSQTSLGWVKRVEVDSGEREGVTTSEREHLKALEREVKELRRVNEILRLASAFFVHAELDRRPKSRTPLSVSIATPSGSSRSARSCGLRRRATELCCTASRSIAALRPREMR